MRRIIRPNRRRRGAAVVEMALVLNLALLLLLGICEFGRFVMFRQILTHATREGARIAVVGKAFDPELTCEAIAETVRGQLAGQSVANLAIEVFMTNPVTGESIGEWDEAEFGGAITVRVIGEYHPMLPTTLGVLPNPIPIRASSMMLSEAN